MTESASKGLGIGNLALKTSTIINLQETGFLTQRVGFHSCDSRGNHLYGTAKRAVWEPEHIALLRHFFHNDQRSCCETPLFLLSLELSVPG